MKRLLLVCLLLPACATSSPAERPVEPVAAQTAPAPAPVTADADTGFISGAQARELVAKGAVLIDVRTPEEYAEKHVEGAKNIPVQELPARIAEVGPKETPVVVYCKSGRRSAKAAEILRAEGYTVYNLGSVENW